MFGYDYDLTHCLLFYFFRLLHQLCFRLLLFFCLKTCMLLLMTAVMCLYHVSFISIFDIKQSMVHFLMPLGQTGNKFTLYPAPFICQFTVFTCFLSGYLIMAAKKKRHKRIMCFNVLITTLSKTLHKSFSSLGSLCFHLLYNGHRNVCSFAVKTSKKKKNPLIRVNF